MKYIKIFEEKKLHDLPINSQAKYKRDDSGEKFFKYKVGDYVIFKPLNKIFCIKDNNPSSDNQDYFIYDPLDEKDWKNKGWCTEEELKRPTKKEKEIIDHLVFSKKYNL